MEFFDRARASGAAEYGRVRAEKYGRIAKFFNVVKVLALLALVVFIYLAGSGKLGG